MRISDWSSDVCSSDLQRAHRPAVEPPPVQHAIALAAQHIGDRAAVGIGQQRLVRPLDRLPAEQPVLAPLYVGGVVVHRAQLQLLGIERSEEHTSELQSLMRNSYSVLCLQKKNHNQE